MMTVKDGSSDSPHSLSVVLRIRPMMPHETTRGQKVAYTENEKVVVLIDPNVVDSSDVLRAKRTVERRYEFDCAMDKDCTQENVYDKTTRNLVDDVLKGFNGTIFAYGATGSGKTYTMAGTNSDPGIMIRALSHIFHVAEKKNSETDFHMSLSYAEIYNDNIRDLLNPTSGYLELREDAKGNHTVVGLAEVGISSSDEVVRLLNKANRQRTQEPTSANRTSSRSHAMLQVTIRQRRKTPQDSRGDDSEEKDTSPPLHRKYNHKPVPENVYIKTGRLYMVDLAGSERASQTQNTGKRLVEGAHINKSLLALGNCINALADRSAKYVNYRDSKLTRLLKVPLSGNCKTVMISHISPSAHHYEETRKTLLYASRAKNINNKVKNNVSNVTHHVAQYQNIISELKTEINRLQDKIEIQDRESKLADIENQKLSTDDNKVFEKRLGDEEMKRLKTELMSCFTLQMELRRKLMDTENALIAIDCDFERLSFMVNEWEAEITRKGNNKKADVPQYIQQAWEDVSVLENEEKRYLKERDEIQQKLEQSRQKAHLLMESLPNKASSDEQRELLCLLTRVHRLEIENMEMQASQLIREQELRQREVMILRYDRQRQLCDEIITKQRLLIDNIQTGRKVAREMAHELGELYRLYQQEMQEIINGRDSVIKYLNSASSQNNGTLALRPLGSGGSLLDLSGTKSISPFSKLPSIKRNDSASKVEDSGNGLSLVTKNEEDVSVSEPVTPEERAKTRTLPKVPENRNTKRGGRKMTDMDKNVVKGAVGCCRGPTFISLKDKSKTNDSNNNETDMVAIKETLPKLQPRGYAERRRKRIGIVSDSASVDKDILT